MKKRTVILAILLALLMLVGCAPQQNQPTENKTTEETKAKETKAEEPKTEGAAAFMGDDVVDAQYVKDNMDKILLIDARGADAAKSGQVKGAIPMAWQELANVAVKPGEEGWGHILPAEELAKVLGAKGISKDAEIVLYSNMDQGWGEDGRILWVLKAAGYPNVKMVNGGIDALKNTVEIVTEAGSRDAVEVSIDKIDYSHSINTKDLNASLDKYVIVDSREKDEYEGATKFGEAKGGHLPGAINIPFTQLFSNGMLKSNDDINALFEASGLTKDKEIVFYCTGGIRSAYMQLVGEMLGYQTKNYEGSYYNWAAAYDVEK